MLINMKEEKKLNLDNQYEGGKKLNLDNQNKF